MVTNNKRIDKFDKEFRFLLKLDPAFEDWRALAAEWFVGQKNSAKKAAALTAFFVAYLHGQKIDKNPLTLFESTDLVHDWKRALGLEKISETLAKIYHDIVSNFLDWVLEKARAKAASSDQLWLLRLQNPITRIQSKKTGSKLRNTNLNFDPQFHFLLQIDPDFEDWRQLAAEWWPQQKGRGHLATALNEFFIDYIHAFHVDKRPVAVFEAARQLPDMRETFKRNGPSKDNARYEIRLHDAISDFLDWTLRTKLAEIDENGYTVVPAHLRHPFPRQQERMVGRGADLTFTHVLRIDPRMENWRALAAEWMSQVRSNEGERRNGIDLFLTTYIGRAGLDRNPSEFLARTTPKPDLCQVLLSVKSRGTSELSKGDIKRINAISDFLEWVLTEKFGMEDGDGLRIVPPNLHNPFPRLSTAGIVIPTETVRSPLSIRYIKELRSMLAEGPDFRDWTWAQQAIANVNGGGDWFMVGPTCINRDDPDCVWRERNATYREKMTPGFPERITELWSPVRAVALYVKLELPLRTSQVCWLDSGEADTWRYVHGIQGGSFVLNDSPLALGAATRPYQRGVFHRSANQDGADLYINTNKTADINQPENAKGYVIPWMHETVLYWLAKLRAWQENYNPINAPTPWTSLEHKHFGRTPPHRETLEARGTACFLFRDATAKKCDRNKPLPKSAIARPWYLLLAQMENNCIKRSETLDDGTPIRFVDCDSDINTHYPPHSLRVSLISYLILDLQLPVAVVSKLIAGHARIIQTIYYTKFGHAYMKEVLDVAERKLLEADRVNHRRFLMDATMEQVTQRFASVSIDAVQNAIQQKSAASFVFEDKGICPVGGGLCDVGGELIKQDKWDPSQRHYQPVPGYPQERNCVRCRFFLSGPAFLPGLVAHFNTVSYEAHERAARHNDLHEQVTQMENRRGDCSRDSRPFCETRELESLSQRYEAEAEAMGKLINDLQATNYLIARSTEIMKQASRDGVQLVAVGEMSDVQVAFTETASELHQIEVLCENAVIYPEIDARKPTLRRSQLLDLMFEFNHMSPIFFRLDLTQQLAAGNAVMRLIQVRSGSLAKALEYVEGTRRLRDLGIVDETWNVITENLAGTPARQIIEAARARRILHQTRRD